MTNVVSLLSIGASMWNPEDNSVDSIFLAVMTIQKYMDECLFEPVSTWPKYCFQERSYSRWAVYELQQRVFEEALQPPVHITGREPKMPITVIEDFISEMDDFSEMSDKRRFQFIFSIARDAAKEVLRFVLINSK